MCHQKLHEELFATIGRSKIVHNAMKILVARQPVENVDFQWSFELWAQRRRDWCGRVNFISVCVGFRICCVFNISSFGSFKNGRLQTIFHY